MNTSKCRACEATIVWSKTTNGSPVPLNPMPVNVAIRMTNDDDAPVVIRSAMQLHTTTCRGKPASVRTRN